MHALARSPGRRVAVVARALLRPASEKRSHSLHERLREKSNFPSGIKLFLPVQSRAKKFPAFPFFANHFHNSPRPTPLEGRIAIVTDAGLDAVDAAALLTNGADADGEVVWS